MTQSIEAEVEVKKPMKRWKKIAIGVLGLFAVFVGAKFTEDNFNDRSSLCTYMGGTPAPRGLYQSTKLCTWTRASLNRMNAAYGSVNFGVEHAKRFCDKERGSLRVNQPDQLQCIFL